MIRTIMFVSLRRLWHNKPELLLTFVVPLIFFSIFAWIFGSKGSAVEQQDLKVVVCDELDNHWSRKVVSELAKSKRLKIVCLPQRSVGTASTSTPTTNSPTTNSPPAGTVTRQEAVRFVRRGWVSAAIVITRPSTGNAQPSNDSKSATSVKILNDSFNQVAARVIAPILQQTLAQQTLAQQTRAQATSSAPPRDAYAVQPAIYMPGIPQSITGSVESAGSTPMVSASFAIPTVDMVDVLGAGKSNPVIAMYAAGIAVMFLLFSATTASGSLLEERENSTLERILCSRVTMDHLLLGKWCYLTGVGCAQVTVMFAWGALAFQLNLRDHIGGFAIMTLVTSGAAAGFALMLAALCRSRTQLGWVSTIVILSMSALGGSMVPRYLMGPSIQRVGQLTFNAWALDGYNKIFWRELPLLEIRTELCVLVACGLLFLIVARLSAIRWERV